MPHMLARLRGVRFDDIEAILKQDVETHAKEGIYLEHLWKNVDDEEEVMFLFRVDDLNHVKAFIDRVHSKALEENPDAHLPHITYLQGRPILFGL